MEDDRRAIYSAKQLLESSEIRVIDIEPAEDFDAPLCCTIRVISLDDRGERYQTLSYAWSRLGESHSILCDGKLLPVSEDLSIAMRRIREKFTPRNIFSRTIWIDALTYSLFWIRFSRSLDLRRKLPFQSPILSNRWICVRDKGFASSSEVDHWFRLFNY